MLRRNAALSGGALLLALAAVFVAAATFRLDIQNWNSVCGQSVRVLDPSFRAQLSDTGFSGKMPFLAEAFLVLAIPAVLARSGWARWTNLGLLLLLIVLLGLAPGSLSSRDYYDECYTGGHENAPGGIAVNVFVVLALVVLCSLCVLLADWVSWMLPPTEPAGKTTTAAKKAVRSVLTTLRRRK